MLPHVHTPNRRVRAECRQCAGNKWQSSIAHLSCILAMYARVRSGGRGSGDEFKEVIIVICASPRACCTVSGDEWWWQRCHVFWYISPFWAVYQGVDVWVSAEHRRHRHRHRHWRWSHVRLSLSVSVSLCLSLFVCVCVFVCLSLPPSLPPSLSFSPIYSYFLLFFSRTRVYLQKSPSWRKV